MKVIFQWVPQQKKFHLQLSHESDGVASSMSLWVSPLDAVNLFNVILAELKKAATNPHLLPDMIRMLDPRKAAAEKILLQKMANTSDDEPMN